MQAETKYLVPFPIRACETAITSPEPSTCAPALLPSQLLHRANHPTTPKLPLPFPLPLPHSPPPPHLPYRPPLLITHPSRPLLIPHTPPPHPPLPPHIPNPNIPLDPSLRAQRPQIAPPTLTGVAVRLFRETLGHGPALDRGSGGAEIKNDVAVGFDWG